MSALLRIVFINDVVVPIVALICNIFLLWLIKTVKTKTSIHINYALVPNSIIDMIFAIVAFIVAPHIYHVGGNIYLIFGDLFAFFGYNMASHLASICSGLAFANMISITASFYIRYLVICKNQKLSIRTMILPYLIVFAVFLAFYSLYLWLFLSAVGNLETSILTSFWKEEYNRAPLFVANKIQSVPFFGICGVLIATFVIAYGLIFYYSMQISNTLKTYIDSNNSGTKLLHKQIQRTLLIQAIGPSLIGSLPFLLILIKSFFNLRSTQISSVLAIFFPWSSLCNPIAAFIFIKPYRDHIKKLFKHAMKSFQRKSTKNISFTVPARITM